MSAHTLQLTITTPLETVYEQAVDQVTVTTLGGEITILPHHVPLVTPLVIGQVMVKHNDREIYHAINGGILEVRHDNHVVILSDRSENVSDIDIKRAEKALARAKNLMNNESGMDHIEYARLEKAMAKELNRVKLAKMKGQRK